MPAGWLRGGNGGSGGGRGRWAKKIRHKRLSNRDLPNDDDDDEDVETDEEAAAADADMAAQRAAVDEVIDGR